MSGARVRLASVHLFCVVSPRAEPQGPRRWGHRQPGAREEQLDSGSVGLISVLSTLSGGWPRHRSGLQAPLLQKVAVT